MPEKRPQFTSEDDQIAREWMKKAAIHTETPRKVEKDDFIDRQRLYRGEVSGEKVVSAPKAGERKSGVASHRTPAEGDFDFGSKPQSNQETISLDSQTKEKLRKAAEQALQEKRKAEASVPKPPQKKSVLSKLTDRVISWFR